MKLAEAYFRRQDFANAQTQFELLAQQKPEARLAEKALFFAARSATSSMVAFYLVGCFDCVRRSIADCLPLEQR